MSIERGSEAHIRALEAEVAKWKARAEGEDDAPAPVAQGEPVGCIDPMCACRGGPAVACHDGEREKELVDLRDSLAFYKRRADALQQAQKRMRDPERTMVCDILANGCLLTPEGERYAAPAPVAQGEPVAWLYTLEYGKTVADKKVSLSQLNYPFGVCGADYLRSNDDGVSYVRQTPMYAAPAPVLTRDHVMSALALCPTDLPHPKRCEWIANKLNEATGQEGGK